MGGISEKDRTGLPSIERMASSVRRPAASAGWPARTWPTRTRGWTPIEPRLSVEVASERRETVRSSAPRRTRSERDRSGRRRTWYCASSQVGSVVPSIETISSPETRPAFSAGEPGSTAPTIGRSKRQPSTWRPIMPKTVSTAIVSSAFITGPAR